MQKVSRFVRIRRSLLALVLLVGFCATSLPLTAQTAPISPKEPIVLFDGKEKKDLSPFYIWLPKFGREDPDKVFTVIDQIDGAPAIRVSGQHWGGFVTKSDYTNYKLVVEYRWGNVTWEPRAKRARDAGILLHAQGEDGNYAKDFKGPWIRSVEFQIIEGGTGDIILVGGFDRGSDQSWGPKLTATVAANGKNWDPKGQAKEFTRSRIDWQYRDLGWKDELGFRGAKDVEKPVGQWNRIEAICAEGDVTYFLNGVKVMEGRNGSFKSGRLLFQSEGAEYFYRLIELHPLAK